MQHTLVQDRLYTQLFTVLEDMLPRLHVRPAQVIDTHPLTERFHLVTLEGKALKGVRWQAGQKLQVRLSGLATRTFTPMLWDADEGVTQFLTHAHRTDRRGHLETWAGAARNGALGFVFGPRESIDLAALRRPALFFGDETSIGLARALKATGDRFSGVAFVLEVSAAAEIRNLLDILNLPDMLLVERVGEDIHAGRIDAAISAALAPLGGLQACAQFVLTGNARSVQRLARRLKAEGVPAARLIIKPHWATGKTGLD